MWEKYREWREKQGSWQEALGWVLEEEGEGERWWMRGGRSKRKKKKKGKSRDKEG